jgi:O-methyltransferase
MAANGVFKETAPATLGHTPLSAVLRRCGRVVSSRGAALPPLLSRLGRLDHAVRTGEPGFNKVFGQPVFDHVMAHPDAGPIPDAGMTSIHGYETAAMLDAYDFTGVRVLADIGGGNGSLLAGVLRRYSAMRGILFDLGHVVARATEGLRRVRRTAPSSTRRRRPA